MGECKPGRTTRFGLVGASAGALRPGVSIVLSLHTCAVAKFISATVMSVKKACARALIAIIAVPARIVGTDWALLVLFVPSVFTSKSFASCE